MSNDASASTPEASGLGNAGRCPLCGAPLHEPDACDKCDWVRGYRQQEYVRQHRNFRDIAAAALSVLPGIGHVYKGYTVQGWLLLLLGVPVICLLAFTFTMYFGWLLVPSYWFSVAMDAYFRKDLRAPQAPASIPEGTG